MKFYLPILLIFGFFCQAQIPSYVPTGGLKGYWPFTGNTNDLSSNANNGTVSGALLTSDRFGTTNAAYSFNGISDYIVTTYAGIGGSNDRAVSFWAKTSVSFAHMTAVGWGGNAQGSRFACTFNVGASTGSPLAGVSTDLGYGSLTYSTNPAISNNSWHHYVWQSSGTSQTAIEIYMDGVLVSLNPNIVFNYSSSTTINTDISGTPNSFPVQFGRLTYASQPAYFLGAIDDIGIWDRKLSVCEIQQLYNSSMPLLTATATKTVICSGEHVTLSAINASNCIWNNSLNGSTISVTPSVTTTYSVSGTNAQGCSAKGAITVTVNTCTGFNRLDSELPLSIFPNPNRGQFTIGGLVESSLVEVYNSIGIIVYQTRIDDAKADLDLTGQAKGLYIIKVTANKSASINRIIIE